MSGFVTGIGRRMVIALGLAALLALPSASARDVMKHARGDECFRGGHDCDCRTGLCEGQDGYGEAVTMSDAIASWRAMEATVKTVGCAPALTWRDGSVTFNRACITKLGTRWKSYASGYELYAYGELKPGDPYYKPTELEPGK